MKKKFHVRKDGSQSYKKEIRINGRRISKRFSKNADAERWYQDKRREKEMVEAGMATPTDLVGVKFSEYTNNWLAKRKQQGKPEGSWLSDYERQYQWVFADFQSLIK